MVCWCISEWGEDLYKFLVCKYSGLGEAVHAVAYFTEDVAVADEVVEIVFVHGFFIGTIQGFACICIGTWGFRDVLFVFAAAVELRATSMVLSAARP